MKDLTLGETGQGLTPAFLGGDGILCLKKRVNVMTKDLQKSQKPQQQYKNYATSDRFL
jgi:hypothetical protein